MTSNNLLPATVLKRKAVVYVRQSTPGQVQNNLESQRRQYELVDVARRWGFRDVDVIDDDLGRTASGTVDRPGFERLVSGLCTGKIGAVLCLDASRLSRNGRDWHHLLELCGLVEARVIDLDGVYDPCRPNDRFLLGMKGSISEFELGISRTRMLDAARAKARRGELRLIFSRFRELGSARQVLISLTADSFHFPRPSDGRKTISFDWVPVRYRSVISILKNPFYAGVYVYGKSEKRTEIVDGRARKSYGHSKPFATWDVLLQEHHEGYIDWDEFERNQRLIAVNAFGQKGGIKSGRGGRALLAGLLTCGRCGRRLGVVYSGRPPGHPYYRCERINQMLAKPRCMTFGASRIDPAIGKEILRALTPMAIEAAMEADRMHRDNMEERHRIMELDLQQARYEASLAERRYAACDPDNRLLIAAQLEKSWEAALRRVETCEAALAQARQVEYATPTPDFAGIATDLETAWRAPNVDMRCRQQLLRTLVSDIIADVDEEKREALLTIHWKGGQHSQLRIRKPNAGEHGRRHSEPWIPVWPHHRKRWSRPQEADLSIA